MAKVRLKATLVFEYDITDDLDRREQIYGTRDILQCLAVDEQNWVGRSGFIDATNVMFDHIKETEVRSEVVDADV